MPKSCGLHYVVHHPHAPGTPLLILPGLHTDGRKLRRLARDLGEGRPLILVDPLGGGRSEAPAASSAYAWPEQAARLIGLLDDLAERGELDGLVRGMSAGPGAGRSVDMLGISLGGMWAQQVLGRAPQRFRRVVLAVTCASVTPRVRSIVLALRALVDHGVPRIEIARCLMFLLFSPEFLDRPGAVPLIEGMLADQAAPGLRGQLSALLEHDGVALLSGRPEVALVIGGAQDWLMPIGEQRRLAGLVPGARLALLPDAGHCLWIEQPLAFADAVRAGLEI